MELAGHGESGKTRQDYTSKAYAEDILAAAKSAGYSRLVLVAHSMGGAYALEAAPRLEKLAAVILVDTVKDLGNPIPPEQIEAILKLYRDDFQKAVKEILPKYLFSPHTPGELVERLQNEFLANPGEFAVKVIEPLYRMDLQAVARQVTVPVRGIGSDLTPSSVENNRKYIKDYDAEIIAGTGHYLMLEKPWNFNGILGNSLRRLGL
jgi:pimeloyl-ACP methyl ester carboxylesterase